MPTLFQALYSVVNAKTFIIDEKIPPLFQALYSIVNVKAFIIKIRKYLSLFRLHIQL